jgi:hypothetical protein
MSKIVHHAGVLRKKILNEKGLTMPPKSRINPSITIKLSPTLKTSTMFQIELKFGMSIEQLLSLPMSHRLLADKLETNFTTISKWRKLLRENGEPK